MRLPGLSLYRQPTLTVFPLVVFSVFVLCALALPSGQAEGALVRSRLARLQTSTPSMPPSPQEIAQSAEAAYNAKHYVEAAALYLYAVARGDHSPDTLYNTACAVALAGDAPRAFSLLDQAAATGYSDAKNLKNDIDLAALHADARWPTFVARIERADVHRRQVLADPDRAPLVTSDIPRFWAAYDRALRLPPPQRAAIFQRDYFDQATGGMRDWIRVRNASAPHLAQFVTDHPQFYAAIRPLTLRIESQRSAIRAVLRKFKVLYPGAQFPGVTFCVGAFYGGGTLSRRGLLLSAEMYVRVPQTPLEELSRWEKSVLTPMADLPAIIAHELVHFQQEYPPLDRTLLRACIQEGSADFLGEISSGSVGQFHQGAVFPYGDAHERELWERFQQDMNRNDKKAAWLYAESGEGKRPDDLGYYIGYKICEAYYQNAANKRQAISDIIKIADFKAFLKASRYGDKFPASASASP